jgi:hypothetical protein
MSNHSKMRRVCTWFVAIGLPISAAIASSLAARAHKISAAEIWASRVADVLTSRNLYAEFPKSRAPYRFASIVPRAEFDKVTIRGQNPALGVLYLYANLWVDRNENGRAKVGGLQIVMPLRDAQKREVYPLLLRMLQQRLRSPYWSRKVDQDPPRIFWRKGKTRYVVHLEKGGFLFPGSQKVDDGPWVIAGAAEEEGDSEDP